jgi:hypothetical protein
MPGIIVQTMSFGGNSISIAAMLVVGIIVGFGFDAPLLDIVAGILLLLLFAYAFSWVFAFVGLTSSSPEAAQSLRFIVILPAHLRLLGLRPTGVDAGRPAGLRRSQPVHDRRRRDAPPLPRHPRRQRRLGRRRLLAWHRDLLRRLSIGRYKRAVTR